MELDKYLLGIADQFLLEGRVSSVNPHGEGHIHDTYLVETADHRPDYILQKINHHVFRNIPGMMKNIEAVTKHIYGKLAGIPGHDPELESLKLVYTRAGETYFIDDDGCYWRMYVFIPGTVTYQKMTDPSLAFEAGKAIGFFQALLTDIGVPLVDTIPDFHNIDFRISQYEQANKTDPAARARLVGDDIIFAENRFSLMMSYYGSLRNRAVLRVTHNDTKVNNVLFDRGNKAQCLIDLDTVMPGYVHFDYGDALRTMSNTALEDEKDLSKVLFNREVYDSFTSGYMQASGGFLTPAEFDLLPYAPIYLTFVIGLRFLTDFLNGDIYYRVHYQEHNLVRARVQFKLVMEMEKVLNFKF
jgi:hypothetical protein